MKINIQKGWLYIFVNIALIFNILTSCESDAFREELIGDFSFSNDTVLFDTIFTGLGTQTFKLLIYNKNNHPIKFDSVYLANKGISGFLVNINGEANFPVKTINIDANDSLFVFIQAFIPSNENNKPFLNEDSLVFVSGNHIKNLKLIAFGQNVIHFTNENIKSQEWFNSKPYLIYGTLTVDSGSSLIIHEGVTVYFHKNSTLKINGTLTVSGAYESPVHFRGDRLEKDYDTIPGQWGGVQLSGTDEKHTLNYALIRNATTGIEIGETNSNKIVKAEISNIIITNSAYASLIAHQANVSAKNTVLANSGNSLCVLYGGSYSFIHCTLANYGAQYITRSVNSKTLILQNYEEYTPSDNKTENLNKDLIQAYFGNSIIYGNSFEEIKLLKKENQVFNYTFENCLLKIAEPAANPNIIGSILNKSPQFTHPENENFTLDSLSSAINSGKIDLGVIVPLDIENKPRTIDLAPDMGAYERITKP